MSDVTRRQVLKIGAVGAGAAVAPLPWAATASAAVAPPEVRAANDLALWYDHSAGTDWLSALPIGNGRLGAMVFGNTDVERLQLNEDTVWAGGPYDQSNPRGAGALAQIRQLVFQNQWSQAQSAVDQNLLGIPSAQLAYQPVGNLRLTFPSGTGVSAPTPTPGSRTQSGRTTSNSSAFVRRASATTSRSERRTSSSVSSARGTSGPSSRSTSVTSIAAGLSRRYRRCRRASSVAPTRMGVIARIRTESSVGDGGTGHVPR